MNLFPNIDYVYLFLLQAFLGLIDICIVALTYERIYGKPSISRQRFYGLTLLCGLIIILACRLVLPYFRPTATPPTIILASLFLLPLFPHADWKKKALYSLVLFALSFSWLLTYDFLVTPMTHKIIWLVEFFSHAGFWLILFVTAYVGREKRQRVPASMWVLLTSISVISIGVIIGTFYHALNRDDNLHSNAIEVATMLALLFINIAVFIVFERLAAFYEADRERSLLEQQLHLQQAHYRQLQQLHDQVRILHHDMKNHLNTASLLATEGNSTALDAYLKSAILPLDQYEQAVVTHNPAMDAMINLKLGELKGLNIPVETSVQVPPGLHLSFELASVIFGNLLDNARDACEKLPPEKRWVKLALAYINGSLVIEMQNPNPGGNRPWKDGLPVTDKKDRLRHGLGLKSVRNALEDRGTLHIEATPDHFSVSIVLYGLQVNFDENQAQN